MIQQFRTNALLFSAKVVCSLAALGTIIAALIVDAGLARAHEGEHPAPVFSDKEQHRPTPLPDRVVLTWSGDPATSIDVTWRTDTTTGNPVAEYARADSLVGNLREGSVPHSNRVAGSKVEFTSDLGTCQVNSAQLKELQPATMYAYRVGDGGHWSEWFQFRTAADSDEAFTFVYFGDAQNAVRSLWSRVIREANQHAPRAAFMLHAGDLINHDNSDAEWGEWFGAGSWLNGMIPVVATPGNHEYDDDDRLSRHWRPQFAFPMNGPSGLEETVYWLDYQGARIISLNSNERIDEQRDWLKSVLSDSSPPKWTIVTFHHPIYSASGDRDNPGLRAAWQPILEEAGVDLVLQGHDHSYARSGLGGPTNLPEGVRRKSSNTVYVVSVSGPKMYESQKHWTFSRQASGVQLFQIIRVSPERIRYEARLATGEPYDGFTLEKDDGGKTTLTEQIPAKAEIRE
jgi:3',5'-cyclic AMP phosphodiesterase CpdA